MVPMATATETTAKPAVDRRSTAPRIGSAHRLRSRAAAAGYVKTDATLLKRLRKLEDVALRNNESAAVGSDRNPYW